MLSPLKSNLVVILIIMLLVSVGYAGMMQLKLNTAKAKIETIATQKSVLQTDLDSLTLTVREQDAKQQQLLLELDFIAALNKKNVKDKQDISVELDKQTNAIQKLRNSNNEAVREWSITPVPDDINRLLEHSSYCANRDNKQANICITATQYGRRMQSAGISRYFQF